MSISGMLHADPAKLPGLALTVHKCDSVVHVPRAKARRVVKPEYVQV
jgi:hypothetical protein